MIIPQVTPLSNILNYIEENSSGEQSVILMLVSGKLAEDRPPNEWFNAPDGWARHKFFNKTQYAVYTKGQLELRIYSTGNYFCEETDIKAMQSAWYRLENKLQVKFGAVGCHLLGPTPAQTGRELLSISLPKNNEYPVLSEDLANFIHYNFGQSRIETFRPKRDVLPYGVHILDGTWMYASCISHLPVGNVYHDEQNEFLGVRRKDGRLAPSCPGLYYITTKVPSDWKHIGIIRSEETDDNGNAIYPNTPGLVFSNWITSDELALAIDNGWHVHIEERIIWPDTNRITDPLRTFRENMVGLRESIPKGENLVLDLQRDAIRAIVLHLIGSFYSTGTLEYKFFPNEELPLKFEPYGIPESVPEGIYCYQLLPFKSIERQSFVHPEWSVIAWGRAKASVTRFALRLPYEDIVSIRTDSVWCASIPEWLASEYTGKPGSFREQDHIKGPFTWPTTSAEMRKFVVDYHKSKRNYEELNQELHDNEEGE